MPTFSDLKRNLRKDYSGFTPLKIAILCDSASQLFVQAIKGYAYELGINPEIFEADYNQIDLQVFNRKSELYAFNPEFIVIFQSTPKLLDNFWKSASTDKIAFAEKQLNYVENLVLSISECSSARILYFNFYELNEGVFGNFSNKTAVSFIYQIRKINLGLMDLTNRLQKLSIIDLSVLHAMSGDAEVHDPVIYTNTDIVFNLDFLPVIAKNTLDVIRSLLGKFNKCLILDLDNTLWGGIIGDDGMEGIQIGELGIGKAFCRLQNWIKQLKERGVILAVCSKNEEGVAKEPFEKHPNMVLRLEDISVFVANWATKVDNIRHIRSILNIGFDSMVFVDDNVFEREMVKTHLPEVTVPQLPADPVDYLSFLQSLNLFETSSYTQEDVLRTQQYREEAKRTEFQKIFDKEDDFLKSLDMVSEVSAFTRFDAPRIAQLSQRSNQFNLRTVRFSEEEIIKFIDAPGYLTFTFKLDDRFGNHGLISLIILEKKRNSSLFINTWIMSCRVLNRGMEQFVLQTICEEGRKNGFNKITGEYIPTNKNSIVTDHYAKLGFLFRDGLWELNLDTFVRKNVFISMK
ncbi:MAG: HAD-IIIC family phosphatase [Bacteroidia bacterium]